MKSYENTLFLDIETLPSQKPGIMDVLKAKVKHPGNITKAESIAKWYEDNAVTAADDLYRKTGLDGTYGEILCIGYAFGNGKVKVVYRHTSEADMLKEFFDNITMASINGNNPSLMVGHNLIAFDLRYIWHRCVINRVQPAFSLAHETRHGYGDCYDTMIAWGGFSPDKRISLSNLCGALGIEVKTGDITGANVYDAWLSGRHQEIQDYCCEDVRATREVYNRLTFQGV